MSMTPEMVRVLATNQADIPQGEHLFSVVHGELPKGDKQLSPDAISAATNFPLSVANYLGMTERRIIVWKIGFNRKVGKRLGDVDLRRVQDIEIVWNKKLAILAINLSDAQPVPLRAPDSASAEHFRMAFLRMRGRA